MSPTLKSSFAAQAAPSPVSSGSKDKFDSFETKFFEQGDEGSNLAVEAERFDDLDEVHKARSFAPSRQFFLGVAVGSALVAVLGCVALWLGAGRIVGRATFTAGVAPEPTPTAAASAVPAVVPAEPVPAPAAPAAANTELAPTPSPPLAKAEPEPLPTPVVAPTPTAAAPAAAKAELEPTPAAAAVEPEPEPAPAPAAADPALMRRNCSKAIKERRNKEILAVCAAAFAADPSAADIAVALARTEFDRGRSAQALAWSKKAIAVDPNAADAYVFIGGAEQNVGHGKAAREAYRRYLQLAPGGRYAADLRAIVGGR
jgi:hypothetical protein